MNILCLFCQIGFTQLFWGPLFPCHVAKVLVLMEKNSFRYHYFYKSLCYLQFCLIWPYGHRIPSCKVEREWSNSYGFLQIECRYFSQTEYLSKLIVNYLWWWGYRRYRLYTERENQSSLELETILFESEVWSLTITEKALPRAFSLPVLSHLRSTEHRKKRNVLCNKTFNLSIFQIKNSYTCKC